VSGALTVPQNDARAQQAPAAADLPPGEEAPGERSELPTAEGGGKADRFWFRGEYLLWKIQRATVPALVGAIPAEQAEIVHTFPDSTITPLFGGASGIDCGSQSGLRLGGGLWLDGERQYGLEGSFFQLAQGRQDFQLAHGSGAFGPLFQDLAAGHEVLIMEEVPGLRAGTVTVDASQRLWGAEGNAFRRLQGDGILDHIDLLAGFRHLQFSEGLLVSGTSRVIPGGRLPCG
jgi:hypothetical protein